jgi:hypothetical protein
LAYGIYMIIQTEGKGRGSNKRAQAASPFLSMVFYPQTSLTIGPIRGHGYCDKNISMI